MIRALTLIACLLALLTGGPALAQDPSAENRDSDGILRLKITSGRIEPMPFALPTFVAEGAGAEQMAADLTAVIRDNLVNSGLFREIPQSAHIARIGDFNAPVGFADWIPLNAQALITGAASVTADGQVVVKFRLWDVFAQRELGQGQQFAGNAANWRRMAHKVSDIIYTRLTGEEGYFDSRVVFVSETGPKNARQKQLAIMDQDGANVRFLTSDGAIVVAPRLSPDNQTVIYTSYASGTPQATVMNTNTLETQSLGQLSGTTFAPRFSPDGRRVALSLSDGANTDIWEIDLSTGQRRQLTDSPAIDTSPSYSPDGSQIVFESDRSGSQQIYVMSASGGEARRISAGDGRYATPVWSPRGDLVAFTKIAGGRFGIGVMRLDGSNEKLLTASYIDEGPTWSPNGRVIMFFRETAGEAGAPGLYSVDITGLNLRRIPTPAFASDPSWSRLLE
jgi:TolB protein